MHKNRAERTVLGLVMAGLSMTSVAQTNGGGAAKTVALSPNAATQQRVLILGDSMMRLLSDSLECELAKSPGVTVKQ